MFRWLLEATIDDRGNVTWFEYKPEDTAPVSRRPREEKTRLGDRSELRQPLRQARPLRQPRAAPTTDRRRPTSRRSRGSSRSSSTTASTTTPRRRRRGPALAVPPDPFSSFRATFDVRTYRLCRRVLMFHAFDELGEAPVLVRSLDLTYRHSPVATTLTSITETGGSPRGRATRPRRCRGSTSTTRAPNCTRWCSALDRESAMPGGVDGARWRFVDLDGEGIPGVLSQQGGALFYRRNDGGGHLGAARVLPRKPNVTAIGSVRPDAHEPRRGRQDGPRALRRAPGSLRARARAGRVEAVLPLRARAQLLSRRPQPALPRRRRRRPGGRDPRARRGVRVVQVARRRRLRAAARRAQDGPRGRGPHVRLRRRDRVDLHPAPARC